MTDSQGRLLRSMRLFVAMNDATALFTNVGVRGKCQWKNCSPTQRATHAMNGVTFCSACIQDMFSVDLTDTLLIGETLDARQMKRKKK